MSTAMAPRTLSLWKSHEGRYLNRDERVQIMAQLARYSKARLMCEQLSILSSYFFLYLDYCAGGSVRAAASSTCDQVRGGSSLRVLLLGFVPIRGISILTLDIS